MGHGLIARNSVTENACTLPSRAPRLVGLRRWHSPYGKLCSILCPSTPRSVMVRWFESPKPPGVLIFSLHHTSGQIAGKNKLRVFFNHQPRLVKIVKFNWYFPKIFFPLSFYSYHFSATRIGNRLRKKNNSNEQYFPDLLITPKPVLIKSTFHRGVASGSHLQSLSSAESPWLTKCRIYAAQNYLSQK